MERDDLYALPLERFVAERGALAKALRADKRRDEASAVAALRKPSVAAWAVNQLVRTQRDAVGELLEAGDALRDAQAQLLAGSGEGRTLRAASERERAAVDALVDAARGLLSTDGHELSPAVVERVDETLHAAALDLDAREQVRHGRLERELRHAGLGLGDAAAVSAVPGGGSDRPRPASPTRTRQPPAQPAPKERERERAEARRAARAAEAAARRRAERAGHALKAAEERRARAAQALEQADEALADARETVHSADEALAAARAELDRA